MRMKTMLGFWAGEDVWSDAAAAANKAEERSAILVFMEGRSWGGSGPPSSSVLPWLHVWSRFRSALRDPCGEDPRSAGSTGDPRGLSGSAFVADLPAVNHFTASKSPGFHDPSNAGFSGP